MQGWEELKIDDLPSDILAGDYVFQYKPTQGKWIPANRFAPTEERDFLIKYLIEGKLKYRYKKTEQKAPSHEEIMTKWWKNDCDEWAKCDLYCSEGVDNYGILGNYENISWFKGRKSADIPPEEK